MATRKKTTGSKRKAAPSAKVSSKAKHTSVLNSLKPIAKEVNVRFEKAKALDSKADDHRLAAALQLATAKDKCDEAGVNFKKWVEASIAGQAYNTVRKLVAVGQAENPALALADLRNQTRIQQATHREKTKKLADAGKTAKTSATPLDQLDNVLASLTEKQQSAALASKAKSLGMAMVPEAQARSGLPALKASFESLRPADKMKFVTWAADQIGATVDTGLGDQGSAGRKAKANGSAKKNKLMDTDPDDLTAIPGFLKRGKAGGKTGKGRKVARGVK